MKKKSLTYSDLSKKEIAYLKELYIQKKVGGMSFKELKDYVQEIITHQINDTVGHEEEMEAWKEMSNFFGEQYEFIIEEIQQKYRQNENDQKSDENPQNHRLKLLEKNNIEKDKEDMWND